MWVLSRAYSQQVLVQNPRESRRSVHPARLQSFTGARTRAEVVVVLEIGVVEKNGLWPDEGRVSSARSGGGGRRTTLDESACRSRSDRKVQALGADDLPVRDAD